MKRALLLITLAICGLAVARSGGEALPSITHPEWVKAYSRAQEAVAKRQYNKALAFLSGGLYEGGVTVSIDTSTCNGDAARVSKAARRALAAWKHVLGDDCPIRLLGNNSTADITLVVVSQIPQDGEALGLIELKKSYQWGIGTYNASNSGTIKIMTKWEGSALEDDELAEVVCHEFGHLLGLADVDHTGFLMGPLVRHKAITAPTEDEADAVVSIRQKFHSMVEKAQAAAKGAA